jgi:transcriptional regulator with XRE-family HTH domain
MEGGRNGLVYAQAPRELDGAAKGRDKVFVAAGLLHAQINSPLRHMPSRHSGLGRFGLSGGTDVGMPKKTKSTVEDPATSKIIDETGQRLTTIRKYTGATQGDVARICGADQSQWSKWERGKRIPEVLVMLRFANRAKVSLDLIYRGIPAGTHPVLLKLLRATIPDLLVEDPTDTDQDTDKALDAYRSAIRESLDAKEDV